MIFYLTKNYYQMKRTDQIEQITPNKSQLNKQFFDSETNESSKKEDYF